MPKLGYKLTEEHKKNISKGIMGHPTSPETIRKISMIKKGKKLSPEHLEKLKDLRFKGKKHTDETKKIMSLKRQNDKHPYWKGGTMRYRRIKILERDDYICQECKFSDKEIMQVDHIIPQSRGGTHDMENLRTIYL